MKHKHFTLLAFLLAFGVFTTYAQCTIQVTDSQPYFEDFESGSLECWTIDANGGVWDLLAGTVSTGATFSYNNNGDEARLISPTLDLSAISEAVFTFSYAMIGLLSVDELDVCYRTSEDDSWHVLETFSFNDPDHFYEASYTLTDLSSTFQVSFLGKGLGGWFIIVDNVGVASTSGGCLRPLNLQASNITPFSALLSWSTTGDEESWVIELNGEETTVDHQPYLMEDLKPGMTYSFRVKANCSNGVSSDWGTPISFNTLCDVVVVTDDEPYFDDFEASDDFLCWTNEILSGNHAWAVDPGYSMPNHTAFFYWETAEALLISVPMDLTEVTQPTLSFRHKQLVGTQNTVDELIVGYRTDPNSNWQTLGYYPDATSDWEEVTIALPNPSATYQIVFDGIGHEAEGIYVDDVRVGKGNNVGLTEDIRVTASVSPNPINGKATITANVTDGEVVVYDLLGKPATVAKLMNGQAEIDLNHVAEGVYMARINSAEGITVIKLVKE